MAVKRYCPEAADSAMFILNREHIIDNSLYMDKAHKLNIPIASEKAKTELLLDMLIEELFK